MNPNHTTFLACFLAIGAACEEVPPAQTAAAVATDTSTNELQYGVDLNPVVIAPCFSATPSAPDSATKVETPTPSAGAEQAIAARHAGLKTCLDEQLLVDPNTSGKSAFRIHIAIDGRVAAMDVLSSCGLPARQILCMKDELSRTRFEASMTGTLDVPVSFAAPTMMRSLSSQVGFTTAHDFVIRGSEIVLRSRAAFDSCALAASARGAYKPTWGVFSLLLDADGKPREIHVDPFAGDQALLGCAAEVLYKLEFTPPPRGAETLRDRISFEPPPP